MPEKLKLKLIVRITKLNQKVVKLIQAPQDKGELSQFRRMNGPEALALTAPPPLWAEPATPKQVDECDIKCSLNFNPPMPTVYTIIHTVGPEVNCNEQGHRGEPELTAIPK